MNADELKKADEIVRALRSYASDCGDDDAYHQCTFAWICDELDGNAPKIIADLIDSLNAQLTESQRREKAAVELVSKIYHTADDGFCDSCREIVNMIDAAREQEAVRKEKRNLMYSKIGEITQFSEIPWGKEIIITGQVGSGWYWNSKGVFIKEERGCRFRDDCGVYTQFAPGDFISLNVLQKTQTGEEKHE